MLRGRLWKALFTFLAFKRRKKNINSALIMSVTDQPKKIHWTTLNGTACIDSQYNSAHKFKVLQLQHTSEEWHYTDNQYDVLTLDMLALHIQTIHSPYQTKFKIQRLLHSNILQLIYSLKDETVIQHSNILRARLFSPILDDIPAAWSKAMQLKR